MFTHECVPKKNPQVKHWYLIWVQEWCVTRRRELVSTTFLYAYALYPFWWPFICLWTAFKERTVEKPQLSNQTQTELITQTANLSINAARSSKILYVITTSPSQPTGQVPGKTFPTIWFFLLLMEQQVFCYKISAEKHSVSIYSDYTDSKQ